MALIALIVSIISLGITVHYANDTQHLESEGQLSQMMLAYLTKYDECVSHTCGAGLSSVDEYRKLSSADQAAVTIVAGLLISVVDAMYRADDNRAGKWKDYIAGIPGPLVGNTLLESYATDDRTSEAIRLASEKTTAVKK
ncbi:MAG: hypothetical protein WCE52_00510 [Candidatus Acidiferrum sp.]